MCDENITAAPTTVERVKKIDNIYIEYNFPVIAIEKINNCIGLFSKKPGSTLSSWYGPYVDGVFIAIGMKPNFKPISDFDIIDNNGYIITNENCETSYDGLFAAGDIRVKNVRQALTAAADGAIAVQSAINYLKNKE